MTKIASFVHVFLLGTRVFSCTNLVPFVDGSNMDGTVQG